MMLRTRADLVRVVDASPRGIPGERLVVLVVDDSGDDELCAMFAGEQTAPSERYTGSWLLGRSDDTGDIVVAFNLVDLERGGDRLLWCRAEAGSQLESVIAGPHLVVVISRELFGESATLEDFAPRLAGALIVEPGDAA